MACLPHGICQSSTWFPPFPVTAGSRPAKHMLLSVCAGDGTWRGRGQDLPRPLLVSLQSSDLTLPTHHLFGGSSETIIITSESTNPLHPGKPSPVNLRWVQLPLRTCKAVQFCQQDGCCPRNCEACSAHHSPHPPKPGTSLWSPQDAIAVRPLAVNGRSFCVVSHVGQSYRVPEQWHSWPLVPIIQRISSNTIPLASTLGWRPRHQSVDLS